MFIVFILGLLVIFSAILWMKKLQWQSTNPFAYVLLLSGLGMIGIMLVPNLPDVLVPNFLEDWAYADAFADGPGGASHMLFLGTILVILVAGGIFSRLAMNLIRGQKSSIAYIVIFGTLTVLTTGAIGMNLKGMNVDVASIVGKEAAPVAQQAVVSTMNAGGTFLNRLSEGFQAKEVYAPQHVIDRAPERFATQKIADMPTFQPWTLKQESEKQNSRTPEPYQRFDKTSGMQDEDYNPADFEPAREPEDNSAYQYWHEDQTPPPPSSKQKETTSRPLRYRSAGPDDN